MAFVSRNGDFLKSPKKKPKKGGGEHFFLDMGWRGGVGA